MGIIVHGVVVVCVGLVWRFGYNVLNMDRHIFRIVAWDKQNRQFGLLCIMTMFSLDIVCFQQGTWVDCAAVLRAACVFLFGIFA